MSDDSSNHSVMTEEGHWHHTGADDRRRAQRREAKDRRDMIRFEIEKEDRRTGKDRRGSIPDWGTDQPV